MAQSVEHIVHIGVAQGPEIVYNNGVAAGSHSERKAPIKDSESQKHFAVLKRYKSESRRKGGCHDHRIVYRVSDRTVEILLYDMRKCQ